MEILVNGFKSCGLFPFSENGINYNKLLKSNKTGVEQENTSGQNTNSVTLQENIFFIESNIDSAVLQQFKNHNCCEEWTASPEHTELYNFWLRCKKTKK